MATEKDEIVDEFTHPTIKLIVWLLFLFVARFILTRLPGLETLVPTQPITFAAVVGAAITLFIVAIVVNFGREIEPRINRTLTAPGNLTADLASATKYLTFFIATIIAYSGLKRLIIPYLLPEPGIVAYNLGFLLIATVPALLFIQRLYTNLDDVTDLLTTHVKQSTGSMVDCPECEEAVRATNDFCPTCGTDISELTPNPGEESGTETCPDCGTRVESFATFCGNCGAEVSDSATDDDRITESDGNQAGTDD